MRTIELALVSHSSVEMSLLKLRLIIFILLPIFVTGSLCFGKGLCELLLSGNFKIEGGSIKQQAQVRMVVEEFFTFFDHDFLPPTNLTIVISSQTQSHINYQTNTLSLYWPESKYTLDDLKGNLSHELGHLLVAEKIKREHPKLSGKLFPETSQPIGTAVFSDPAVMMEQMRSNPQFVQQMMLMMNSKATKDFYTPFSELMADTFEVAFTNDVNAPARDFRADGPTPSSTNEQFRGFNRMPETFSMPEIDNAYFRMGIVRGYLGKHFNKYNATSVDRSHFTKLVCEAMIEGLEKEKDIDANIPIGEYIQAFIDLNRRLIASLALQISSRHP